MIDFVRTPTVDTAEILRVGEFHQAIRNGDNAKVEEMLTQSPELCYLKQSGKSAIHIATECLNGKALEMLFNAEERIPASVNYELRKQCKPPIIFQRMETDQLSEHQSVLSNVTNKTSLEMLVQNFDVGRLDVVIIRDILEKREEAELQEFLSQIKDDPSGAAPYTLEQIQQLGRIETPYALSTLWAANPMNSEDPKDRVAIAVFLEDMYNVANVPTIPSLDNNGKPAGVVGVDGVTPLHVAALAGDKVVTQKILDGSNDPRVKNAFGLTAGDMATVMARAHGRAAGAENLNASMADPEKAKLHEKRSAKHNDVKAQYQEVAAELKIAEKEAEKKHPGTQEPGGERGHSRLHRTRVEVQRANANLVGSTSTKL